MKTRLLMKPIFLLVLSLLLVNTANAIPNIHHWQTDNGARVYFVEAPELPMVDIEVVFDAGSARDGDKLGIAMLTNDLLSEGADGYSADQIAEHFENLGAELRHSVDRDMATVSLRSLTEAQLLQPALDMLARVIAKPDFEATSLERTRQQRLTYLKYQQQSPDSIAEKAFYQAIYGDHPYANLPDGTSESVTALTREEIIAFHSRYYVTKNAQIAIVGALDKVEAKKLANIIVSQLATGEIAPALPAVSPLNKANTQHIEHPSTQTHVLIGQPGIKRGDPDHFILYVGNYILGGSGLISRLGKEVRGKQGLAYSTYSYFFPQKVAGPFLLNLETRNEQAEQALQVVQKLLHDFVENGPSETELTEAKQGITGKFPLRIKSNSSVISYLSTIGFYHLPLDYLHTFNNNIEAVTLEMIRDAFKRRLNLDKLVTVTVGGNK